MKDRIERGRAPFWTGLSALLACLAFLTFVCVTGARAEDRSLYLHQAHTGETLNIVYKRNGRFDAEALGKLNHFMRDWRNGKQTEMAPALYDVLWNVYRQTGATKPITVISAYRSPETNAKLRQNSSGVAENSLHTKGLAVDFYIPGVKLATVREAAFRTQGGGVGYYPTSGSPFVHVDVGNVRSWPRMTTAQLLKIFPDGKTAYLPSDGPELPGYRQAVAELASGRERVVVAAATPDRPPQPTLMDRIFGGKSQAPTERIQPAIVSASLAGPVIPQPRPADLTEPAKPQHIPMPVPRPASLFGPPKVGVVEGDYVLLGYTDTRAMLEAEDPFDFLKDLGKTPEPPVATADQADAVAAEVTPSVVASGPIRVTMLYGGALMHEKSFASMVKPDTEHLETLLTSTAPALYITSDSTERLTALYPPSAE